MSNDRAQSSNGTGKQARPVSSFLITQTPKQLLFGMLTTYEDQNPEVVKERWWENTKKLLWHIIRCSQINFSRHDKWVPISRDFIQKHFRGARWEVLKEIGFLECRRFSARTDDEGKVFPIEFLIQGRKSREFCVPLDLLTQIADLTLEDLNQSDSPEVYDLVKGCRKERAIQSEFYDSGRNEIGKLVGDRIRAIGACQFNDKRIRHHLQELKRGTDAAKNQYGVESYEFRSACARYLNDLSCYSAIRLDCRAVPLQGEIWIYRPPYKTQSSGRITHRKGGLQSASKKMQAAAFYGIPGYWNGDMPASQPKGMIQLMKQAGVDASWLETYTNQPNGKHIVAKKIGIPAQTWKNCLNPMLMGTVIPNLGETTHKWFVGLGKKIRIHRQSAEVMPEVPAIVNQLLREFKFDGEQAYQAYERLYEETEALIKALHEYHLYIKTKVIAEAKSCPRYGPYVINQAEAKLFLNDLEGDKVAKVAAHLLQGHEAAFMAAIYKLGKKYSYTIHQDMHDGAIFSGRIPSEAMAEARQISGVEGSIEEKPFDNPQEMARANQAA